MTSNFILLFSPFFYSRVTNNSIPPYNQESRLCRIFCLLAAHDIFVVRAIDKVIKPIAEYVKEWYNFFFQLLNLPKCLFYHTGLQYSENFIIFIGSISSLSFVDLSIISYNVFAQLVWLKTSRCKVLYTGGFLLTCWLKPKRAFFNGQTAFISSHRQIIDGNSQH